MLSGLGLETQHRSLLDSFGIHMHGVVGCPLCDSPLT
jgi:hypothetical protein